MTFSHLPDAIRRVPDAIPLLPEHKIAIFVRFLPLEPLFSGVSSTKSRFLCSDAGEAGLVK